MTIVIDQSKYSVTKILSYVFFISIFVFIILFLDILFFAMFFWFSYYIMESPFKKQNSAIVMYLEPFLNSYSQTYQNIITLSDMPDGSLANMVTSISSPKLSPFQYLNNCNNPNNCIFVLLRYPKQHCGGGGNGCLKHPDFLMGADDIPSIFGYLRTNGYSIDTEITKMMNKSRVLVGGISDTRFSGDRKMICMFSYSIV